MGWFDGGDDTSGWNMSDWYGSDNSDTSGWNMSDWYAANNDNSPSSSWFDNMGSYDYGSGDGGAGGTNWAGLASSAYRFMNSPAGGALMAGAAGYLGSQAEFERAQERARLNAQLTQENYAAARAVDDQYYQAHGQQLADALGNYAQYYRDPSKAENNPTNIFGLLTPHPTTGPLANGW